MIKGALLLFFALLCSGCANKGLEKITTEEHLSADDKRFQNMGKFFKKDLVFWGHQTTPSESNPFLFQATLDVLAFMTLKGVSYQSGIVETAWYFSEKNTREKIKVLVHVHKGKLAIQNLHIHVLCKKYVSGKWKSFKPSAFTVDHLLDKIMKRARTLKAKSYKT